MARYSIKENRYGNWYGYKGNKRVEIFFAIPGKSQEDSAKEWLQERTKKTNETPTLHANDE